MQNEKRIANLEKIVKGFNDYDYSVHKAFRLLVEHLIEVEKNATDRGCSCGDKNDLGPKHDTGGSPIGIGTASYL